jgi:hypothetical protein
MLAQEALVRPGFLKFIESAHPRATFAAGELYRKAGFDAFQKKVISYVEGFKFHWHILKRSIHDTEWQMRKFPGREMEVYPTRQVVRTLNYFEKGIYLVIATVALSILALYKYF